ncbi:hypothetical protein OO013_02585 [Mangrovivirga sp. M17]|uniref:Lipoprotein n=1 Tax=Mangrovivirga halotolerans TaxID=2993936 RepID=A0ABT3RLP4_9BACT|nr:hypothetical protein [Mangrovivirga halotolerans]MCX2742733.1 hypothetical protein [Mangrovivirga halotolerans]
MIKFLNIKLIILILCSTGCRSTLEFGETYVSNCRTVSDPAIVLTLYNDGTFKYDERLPPGEDLYGTYKIKDKYLFLYSYYFSKDYLDLKNDEINEIYYDMKREMNIIQPSMPPVDISEIVSTKFWNKFNFTDNDGFDKYYIKKNHLIEVDSLGSRGPCRLKVLKKNIE